MIGNDQVAPLVSRRPFCRMLHNQKFENSLVLIQNSDLLRNGPFNDPRNHPVNLCLLHMIGHDLARRWPGGHLAHGLKYNPQNHLIARHPADQSESLEFPRITLDLDTTSLRPILENLMQHAQEEYDTGFLIP